MYEVSKKVSYSQGFSLYINLDKFYVVLFRWDNDLIACWKWLKQLDRILRQPTKHAVSQFSKMN